ncbi:hypothetical protein AD428_19925 [Achromobacter sp. DMS1]|nr:hypothetical protein AD428_19925 [Achromobacter sp. DMS1]
MAAVVGFVEDPSVGLDLPLDVRGTAFQRKVWQALRDIPPGSTITYTELARRIGSPRAVQLIRLLALRPPCPYAALDAVQGTETPVQIQRI